jgi:hypothetical protein
MGAAMNDARERMRRIREEDQLQNVRGYSADPWGRQRLEGQRHEGTPVAGARVPRNATFEQDGEGKWWINKPAFGPFESVMDAELAVFGSSTLSGGKRDFRDGPPSE